MALHIPQVEHATALARVVWEKRIPHGAIAENLSPPVSRATVTRWLNGERAVPEGRWAQLAELLGVSEDEIRGDAHGAAA